MHGLFGALLQHWIHGGYFRFHSYGTGYTFYSTGFATVFIGSVIFIYRWVRLDHSEPESSQLTPIKIPLKTPPGDHAIGIKLDGAPHEILGIDPRATVPEIKSAYKILRKKYLDDELTKNALMKAQEAMLNRFR